MDNTEFDSSLEDDENIAIDPVIVEVPVENRSHPEFIDVDDTGLPDADSESDDSDFIIRLNEEHMLSYEPLENSNVSTGSSAADDDDFCIVYEKFTPTPDIQVVVNYHSASLPKRSRNIHSENNSVTPENPDSLDDSVCIIDEIPPVRVDNIKINEAFLNSNEKKKRKIECGVCFDGPDEIAANGRNLASTTCGHIFCNECVKMAIKVTKQCPQCRKKLTSKQYHPVYI